MLNEKRVISIIPVRGGSKGIPGKNLLKVRGETLLERTIQQSLACSAIDATYVSTDDQAMFDISKKYNVNTEKVRPKELASDEASTIDVVFHVLEEMREADVIVVLLQVTTPFRNKDDFDKVLQLYLKGDCDSVASVSLLSSTHPDKVQMINNGYLQSYLSKSSHTPRQRLPEVYTLNGAFYVAHDSVIREECGFISGRTKPYLMPYERSVNLDTAEDVILMNCLIQNDLV